MSLIEEARNIVVEKTTAEEKVIASLKQNITQWASWGYESGNFSTLNLRYTFLESGLIKSNDFQEVMSGVKFVVKYLEQEGFKVEMKVSGTDINIYFDWSKN